MLNLDTHMKDMPVKQKPKLAVLAAVAAAVIFNANVAINITQRQRMVLEFLSQTPACLSCLNSDGTII